MARSTQTSEGSINLALTKLALSGKRILTLVETNRKTITIDKLTYLITILRKFRRNGSCKIQNSD